MESCTCRRCRWRGTWRARPLCWVNACLLFQMAGYFWLLTFALSALKDCNWSVRANECRKGNCHSLRTIHVAFRWLQFEFWVGFVFTNFLYSIQMANNLLQQVQQFKSMIEVCKQQSIQSKEQAFAQLRAHMEREKMEVSVSCTPR